MRSGAVTSQPVSASAFEHSAFFYSGLDQYVAETSAFIRAGVEAGEPTYVVVNAEKIKRLKEALGPAAEGVQFADMAGIGINPARIIPAWQEFVNAHSGTQTSLRGIGEPIWAERLPSELIECQRHESLLNVAFDAAPPFKLLCPYDVAALPEDVLHEARRSHPILQEGSELWRSEHYRGLDDPISDFEVALEPVPAAARSMVFAGSTLGRIRGLVNDYATDIGMPGDKIADALVAVTEVACNSLRHGAGDPTLFVWHDAGMLMCQVEDFGVLQADALVGRRKPGLDQEGGRGMWLANQLCDLVQLRGFKSGTVVRLHLRY